MTGTLTYQAHGKGGSISRDTPRAAALAYFEAFPKSRKCDVRAGERDGAFFTMTYRSGNPPKRWRDVTTKIATTLPAIADRADLGGSTA